MLKSDGAHVTTPETMLQLSDELMNAADKTIPVRVDMLRRAGAALRHAAGLVSEVSGVIERVRDAEDRADKAETLVADVAAGFNLINAALARVPVAQNVQIEPEDD